MGKEQYLLNTFEIFEVFSFDFSVSFLKLLFLSAVLESVCLKLLMTSWKQKS